MEVSAMALRLAGHVSMAILMATFALCRPAFADRMALWNIVHGACVPHAEANLRPKPCVDVDLANGQALLKDLNGVAQQLAIPTRRVTGIEDPYVLDAQAPNYFSYAWKERTALEARLKKPAPREAVGIAINSLYSRSQDQLHLHVDCMNRSVATTLQEHLGEIGPAFKPMSAPLNGRTYWARRVTEAELAAKSPFLMLADGVEGAKAQMGAWSLILIGATLDSGPGFVLLADHSEMIGGGHAEDLQDHECSMVLAP